MVVTDTLSGADDTIQEFSDGQSMLDALEDAPDLILLDVEMSGMDGISACRALRASGNEHTQVIFISSHDDLPTRLAAYAAGASDFIVKPFVNEDIKAKVEVARGLLNRHSAIASNAQFAQKTAFSAISSMGELGVVLQFLRASFGCKNTDTLAAAILEAVSQYGLDGVVELRMDEAQPCYSTHGDCSPLERSVLTHARSMERIFRFRSQMAINYPAVTLVIVNLPTDEDTVGRLRDHLAMLAEGADARLHSLREEQINVEQSHAILASSNTLTQAVNTMEQQQTDTRIRILDAGNNYLDELTKLFVRISTSDGQENALYDMAKKHNEYVSDLINESAQVAEQLHLAIEQLRAQIKN